MLDSDSYRRELLDHAVAFEHRYPYYIKGGFAAVVGVQVLLFVLSTVLDIDNNGKTISDRNDRFRSERICKELIKKYGLHFANGKEQVKVERLREPDKTRYGLYQILKAEVGRCKDWNTLLERLKRQGVDVQFKYKGQTGEIQGVSFSKGEYTFKGSEIDRNFSFSKLDKCFGDAGLNTVGNQRQTAFTPVREPLPTQGKTDSPLITGSLGLFTASSPPADEEPNLNLRKKKKKKKQLNL